MSQLVPMLKNCMSVEKQQTLIAFDYLILEKLIAVLNNKSCFRNFLINLFIELCEESIFGQMPSNLNIN